MAPTVGRTRVIKTSEQKAILKNMYEEGMTSAKQKEMIQEASRKTHLSQSSITDWINNQRKPNRGSVKKRTSKFNLYTAFLASSGIEFDPNSQTLGEFTRARALEYRRHKQTPEGRLFLEENLKKMNDTCNTNLSDIQKRGRASGMCGKIKEQCANLDHLGYTACAIVAHPDGRHTILGSPKAVYYFRNREKIATDFVDHFSQEERPIDNDCKEVLCHKVRALFNKLYVEASGKINAPMPYAAIDAGLNVSINGLPEGITFKRPNQYRAEQMQSILAFQNALTVIFGPEGSEPPGGVNNLQQPNLEVQDIQNAVREENTSPTQNILDTCNDAIEEASFIPVTLAIVTDDCNTTTETPIIINEIYGNQVQQGNNEISLEHSTPAEAMASALANAKAHQEKTKRKKNKVHRTKVDKLVGKEVSHKWTMLDGSKQWYHGVILGRSEDNYEIQYEDGVKEDVSVENVAIFRKNKTLVIL